MDTSGTTFGDVVRRARLDAGYTQEGLASKVGVNKETVMRIEQGHDTKIRTITKLRSALPGLPDAARKEDMATVASEIGEMATRIAHMVHVVVTKDRLHQIHAYVLQHLLEEQSERLTPSTAATLNAKQVHAEERIIERARKAKPAKRRRTDGGHH